MEHHFADAYRVSACACSGTNCPASHAFIFEWLGIVALPGIAVSTLYVEVVQYTVLAFTPFFCLFLSRIGESGAEKALRLEWRARTLLAPRQRINKK